MNTYKNPKFRKLTNAYRTKVVTPRTKNAKTEQWGNFLAGRFKCGISIQETPNYNQGIEAGVRLELNSHLVTFVCEKKLLENAFVAK